MNAKIPLREGRARDARRTLVAAALILLAASLAAPSRAGDDARPSAEVQAIINAAKEQVSQEKFSEAATALRDAMADVPRGADRDALSIALSDTDTAWARKLVDQGRPEEAIPAVEEALRVDGALPTRRVAVALDERRLAVVYDKMGKKEEVVPHLQRAAAILRAENAGGELVTTLRYFGIVSTELGRREDAIAYYHEALPLSSMVKDIGQHGDILAKIAAIYSDQGQYEKAIATWNLALPDERASANADGEANVWMNMGYASVQRGLLDDATRYYGHALPLEQRLGDKGNEIYILDFLADIARRQRRYSVAIEYYKQTLGIGSEDDDAKNLELLGDTWRLDGGPHPALDYYQKAETIRESKQSNFEAEALQLKIGDTYRELHQTDAAIDAYRKALEIGQRCSDGPGVERAKARIAAAEAEKDRGKQAVAVP